MAPQNDEKYKAFVFSYHYNQDLSDNSKPDGEFTLCVSPTRCIFISSQRTANLPGPISPIEVVTGLGDVKNSDGTFNILNKVSR